MNRLIALLRAPPGRSATCCSGLAALVAFAVPLWYAWNVTIFSGREEILHDDAQRLTEVFEHDGVAGLTAHIDARVGMQIAGERTLLLTDSRLPAAGRQPRGLAAGTCRDTPARTP